MPYHATIPVQSTHCLPLREPLKNVHVSGSAAHACMMTKPLSQQIDEICCNRVCDARVAMAWTARCAVRRHRQRLVAATGNTALASPASCPLRSDTLPSSLCNVPVSF